MTHDDIDRALREDRKIEPSPYFAGRVMRAVRRQAADRGAIAFPWKRLAAGTAACAAVTIAGIALGAPAPDLDALAGLLHRLALTEAAIWVPATLMGSWALVRGSMRLAGYRR